MDIKELYTAVPHEEGAEIRIANPNDGKETDFYIHVKGIDSKSYRDAVRAYHRKLLNKEEDPKISQGLKLAVKSIFDSTSAFPSLLRGLRASVLGRQINYYIIKKLASKFAPRFWNLVPANLLDLLAIRVMRTGVPKMEMLD